jgi:HPt (histidine-containing phosphotransfer) domain-containing protein
MSDDSPRAGVSPPTSDAQARQNGFLEDTPQRLDHIRDALVDNDCKRLERAAHTLKGSVGNLCAYRAYETAKRLERLAHTGDGQRIMEAVTDLEMEMAHLQLVLSAFVHAPVS